MLRETRAVRQLNKYFKLCIKPARPDSLKFSHEAARAVRQLISDEIIPGRFGNEIFF